MTDRTTVADRRMTEMEILTLTASAIRKVHRRGERGIEMVTKDEIVALVGFALSTGRAALEEQTRKEKVQ